MAFVRRKVAAEYLGISERTLSTWMRRGVVPYSKMSRKCVLFHNDELDAAVARRAVNSGGKKETDQHLAP